MNALKYTISRETGKRLRLARLGQVKAAKMELERELSAADKLDVRPYVVRHLKTDLRRAYDTRTNAGFFRVQFVNGSTMETALPTRIFAGWIGAATVEQIEIVPMGHAVVMFAGTSRIDLRPWAEIPTRYERKSWEKTSLGPDCLGAALVLTAPVEGGEFRFEPATVAVPHPETVPVTGDFPVIDGWVGAVQETGMKAKIGKRKPYANSDDALSDGIAIAGLVIAKWDSSELQFAIQSLDRWRKRAKGLRRPE